MTSSDCLVGIDIGTTSTRAVIFNAQGDALAEGRCGHESVHPRPGWAEEEAAEWWHSVCAASRQAISQFPLPKEAIKGIAVTSMRQSFVCLDQRMQPLRAAILWYDTRHSAQVDWVRAHIGAETVYAQTGSPPGRRAVYKVMWLRDNEPQVYQATAKITFIPDFILLQMTGELATTPGVSFASGCLNVKEPLSWAEGFLTLCGIDPDKWIACIRPPGTIAGLLHRQAAELTGYPEGTPVVLAAGDQACGNLGVGVCQPGILGINGGTSCALQTPSERLPLDPSMSFFVDFSPAGYYVAENGVTSGTAALTEWFRDQFTQFEQSKAENDDSVWDRIYDLASQAPAGSDGLMLVPYLRGANGPLWDPRARGVLVGLTTDHTRASLLRAIFEGLAFESRSILERMELGTGAPICSIRSYGGASQNAAWNQIFADVLGRLVAVGRESNPVALGAAISAGYGVGIYPSPVEAASSMIHLDTCFEPDSELSDFYAELYQRVYIHLYPPLQTLMSTLSQIIAEGHRN